MGRIRNWLAVLAFIPLVTGLTACELRSFALMIPDFDESEVLGVRVWREDPETGEVVESVSINFEETFDDAGGEEVLIYGYTFAGQPLDVTVPTVVHRDDNDPSQVTLRLTFLPIASAGSYRVSTFNDFGDSPLAEGAFTL